MLDGSGQVCVIAFLHALILKLQKSKSTIDMTKYSSKLGDMKTLEKGIHRHVPFHEYQQWDAISKHDLDDMARSPAHFQAAQSKPQLVTPAMTFGTACHTMILEPQNACEEIAVMPKCDRRTKAGKEMAAEFKAASDGMAVITQEEYDRILEMRMAVDRHPVGGPMVKNARYIEASANWEDPSTGLRSRCRPDIVHDDLVVDLKTAMDAGRWAFASSMHKFRYHVQAAYYLDGLINLGVVSPNAKFIFLVVEKLPPHAVAIYAVQQEDIERGRLQYERDIIRYARCKKENHWPGYSEAIGYIDLPIFSRREIDALTGNH